MPESNLGARQAEQDDSAPAQHRPLAALAKPQQKPGEGQPQERVKCVAPKIAVRSSEPTVQRVTQLKRQQQARKQDTAGFEHPYQGVVGAAAELARRDNEGERRYAVAIE